MKKSQKRLIAALSKKHTAFMSGGKSHMRKSKRKFSGLFK